MLISIFYLLSFLVAWIIFPLLPITETMLRVLIVDIAATIVIFVFSVIYNNSSIYDPYWSVLPPFVVVYLMGIFPEGDSIRQLVILSLVLFWSIRLTVNWFRGWQGFSHQDWRYTAIAEKTGKWYWPVSFLGIHLMPTLFVFLGCLPLWFSLSSNLPFGTLDLLATLFTFFAIVTEWVADEQLIRFRKGNEKGTFMSSGIWNYCRHPNYLGEICFWGGMFLFVVSSNGMISFNGYWTIIGLFSMVLLFNFISIPLMERRNIARKPGYKEYIARVPALMPRIYSAKQKIEQG